MKIVTVVGARPQFIKAAAVSRVIRRKVNEILVHTGQHYDANMSDIFFDELSIPKPDHNLNVGSGSHAKQTGDMLIKIEDVLLKEKPDAVLVYGDTNSTLAGALAAVKIHIPVIHVEAGLRSFNNRMPEEINRIITDRISSLLFCPTRTAVDNLTKEGITDNVYDIGDVMCDAVKYYEDEFAAYSRKDMLGNLKMKIPTGVEVEDKWYLATVHRAENTDDISKIENILNAFERLSAPVIFPVHPRTKTLVERVCAKNKYKNIMFCEPLGYKDMLYFIKNAEKVVTDSGGLQKETYILRTPCVTVREQTEWVETLEGGWNVLASPDTDDIINKVDNCVADIDRHEDWYGDGHAAEKMLKILTESDL